MMRVLYANDRLVVRCSFFSGQIFAAGGVLLSYYFDFMFGEWRTYIEQWDRRERSLVRRSWYWRPHTCTSPCHLLQGPRTTMHFRKGSPPCDRRCLESRRFGTKRSGPEDFHPVICTSSPPAVLVELFHPPCNLRCTELQEGLWI